MSGRPPGGGRVCQHEQANCRASANRARRHNRRQVRRVGPIMQKSSGSLATPERLRWTPRLVTRFWNGVAQIPGLEEMSFAKLVGPVLVEFMTPWIAPGARCLDYGGGSGYLLNLMVKAGFPTAIFEPSTLRAGKVPARLQDEPGFLGAIGSHDRATFDFVVCTE